MTTTKITLKLDAKGRISIPRQLREEAGLEPGDAMFAEYDGETGTLAIRKSINPFDGLALHALEEYRAGRTRSLDDIMAELGVEPEHDESG